MKFCHISDTHGYHNEIDLEKDIDCIICTGDVSYDYKSLIDFIEWFKNLDIEHKILISGNHDKHLFISDYQEIFNHCKERGIVYLQDTSVEINGIKIYGTPWTPVFFNWYFMLNESNLKEKWDMIPEDTDILLTHGPAYQILDEVDQHIPDPNVGSLSLRKRLESLDDLKYHLTGHIHEAYGIYKDRYITLNSAIADYEGLNKPQYFDLEIK